VLVAVPLLVALAGCLVVLAQRVLVLRVLAPA
jgi:hypothetical protein